VNHAGAIPTPYHEIDSHVENNENASEEELQLSCELFRVDNGHEVMLDEAA